MQVTGKSRLVPDDMMEVEEWNTKKHCFGINMK